MVEMSYIYFITSLLVELILTIAMSHLIAKKIAQFASSGDSTVDFDTYFSKYTRIIYFILLASTVGIVVVYILLICKSEIQIKSVSAIVGIVVIILLNLCYDDC